MTQLAIVLGTTGAILLLVALVGGGFSFSGAVMPIVSKGTRLACFAVGGPLIVGAIVIGLASQTRSDPTLITAPPPVRPTPAPTPPTTPTTTPTTPPPTTTPTTTPTTRQTSTTRRLATGTIQVPAGYVAYTYQTPSLSSPIVQSLTAGTTVGIVCTVQGEVVSGYGGASTLWNRLTDGSFLPDTNVYTGTNQPTMPQCA